MKIKENDMKPEPPSQVWVMVMEMLESEKEEDAHVAPDPKCTRKNTRKGSGSEAGDNHWINDLNAKAKTQW